MLDSGPLPAGPGALPREFGAYLLMEEVARGGMGIVYRARQHPVNRTVALKVMASGLFAAPEVVDRFRIEADAAASLDHPNIVPVYEAGECDGQPFFSMKLIEGRSLAQRLTDSAAPMSQVEAAALLTKLARAVHYAHQRGILHRDIKPGNVLLDEQGEPHLTDFGLAKLAEHDSNLTRSLAMLGTPSYMSPEQARGEVKHLTTAADVYGLGAILYELLADRPPFAGNSTMETARQVLEKEAVRPSAINPAVDRDLDTICLKCLEKDPARRYGSAEALAADLERWLRHEPILARPSTTLERTAKWIRRNRGAFAALCLIALSLTAGAGVSTWLALKESKARQDEVNQRIAAQAARVEAEKHQETAEAATKQAEANLNRAEWLVYAGKVMLAQASFEAGNGGLALHHLEQCRPDLRGWEWRHLWARFSPILTLRPEVESGSVWSPVFGPDGRRIAAGGDQGTVTLWEAATGRRLFTRKRHTGPVCSVAFSADGRFFVTGGHDGMAWVWDAEGRDSLSLKGHSARVRGVAISPDSQRIVTASDDGTAKVWDALTGAELLTLPGQTPLYCAAFSHDGGRIVTGGHAGPGKVWDAATGRLIFVFGDRAKSIRSVAFSPDGHRIATAGGTGRTANVWGAATGQQQLVLAGHKDAVNSVAFSPDGARIITSSEDQTAIVWDARTGEALFQIRGHTDEVRGAAFNFDGKRILTGGEDGTVKVWDARLGQEVPVLRNPLSNVRCIAFSPDSRQIAITGPNNTVRVREIANGRELLSLQMNENAVNRARSMEGVWGVAFSPDGRRIVAGGEDECARVWDAVTGEEVLRLRHADAVSCVAFSPDGRHIATGFGGWVKGVWGGDRQSGEARVWDAVTGAELCSLRGHTGLVTSVAFSPDGTRIATGSWDYTAKIWNAATGSELLTLKGHDMYVWCVAFSPDSKRMVTGSHDHDAKVWDAVTGQEIFTLRGHTNNVRGVAFSPDGTRIVTCSDDRTAKIWEAGTGLELFSTREHTELVWSVAFSPDGQQLATGTAGSDAGVEIWSAVPPAREQEEKSSGE